MVLVLVAKRMCKYSLSPNGEDREQLLPNLTEDPGYGEYAFLHRCIICVYVCLLDAAEQPNVLNWITQSGMSGGDNETW